MRWEAEGGKRAPRFPPPLRRPNIRNPLQEVAIATAAQARQGSLVSRLVLAPASRVYDALERRWDSFATHRAIGVVLVVAFLGSVAAIELNRRGLLPAPLATRVATNHFAAVAVAFTLLLILEVLALVFALAQSVANAVGKQFELLSLILLRKAFQEFGGFGEPIEWERVAGSIPAVLSDMAGALLVFVVVGVYYRIQRHQPITADEVEQAGFVAAKKAVAVVLLAAFVLLGIVHFSGGIAGTSAHAFFEVFFTVLIFSDVLLVLVALCYSSSYHVVFRNSGFAAATVIIRLALTAPGYVNVLLGLGAALFAVGLSLAYNTFSPAMRSPSVERVRGGAPGAEARTAVVGLHAVEDAETDEPAAAARVPADSPQGVL